MGDTVASSPRVEGIGVGEKGPPPCADNPIHDGSQENGPEICAVAYLSEMELDGHQVVLLYAPLQLGPCQQTR